MSPSFLNLPGRPDYGIPLDGCRVPGGPAAQGQYLAQADDNLRGKLIRVNAAAAIKTGGLWVRGESTRKKPRRQLAFRQGPRAPVSRG